MAATKQKIQRNDPCPCGSGFQYRLCCFVEQAAKAAGQQHRSRMAIEALAVGLTLEYAQRHRTLEQWSRAWREYTCERGRAFEPADMKCETSLSEFVLWFLFHNAPGQRAPGFDLIQKKRVPAVKAVIKEVLAQPFTFWMAKSFEPGQPMPVVDLLLGREFLLTEPETSALSEPGDVFYGRLVHINGLHGLFGSFSGAVTDSLPMSVTARIEVFRQATKPASLADLHVLDRQTRELWQELWHEYDDEEPIVCH